MRKSLKVDQPLPPDKKSWLRHWCVYGFDYLHPVEEEEKNNRETMTVDLITRPENDGVHDLPGTRREWI